MPRSSTTLSARDRSSIRAMLARANGRVARDYPGESLERQPIHSVYGGAHLFTADAAPKLGRLALGALDEYAPDGPALAAALQLEPEIATTLATTIRERVVRKLQREPVEDYRLDFEDGYGHRPDAEEDGHAQSAAEQVALAFTQGTLPPFIGIRIKPLSNELQGRSLRTLDLFVTTLARALDRSLPPHFVITIPKLMSPAHVKAVVRACAALERRLRLRDGALRLELMIETPQSVIGADGRAIIRDLVHAGAGRIRGAHFGTYDYTASCGITASWQHMQHAVCGFAKHVMQISLAQTGVWLSDGATNVLPTPIHRPGATPLSDEQRQENRASVHRAWRLHFADVQQSLVNGFYQGWDLHPAQLPTRYAAFYAFFLAARPGATGRLRNFVDKAAQATMVGDVFDDAATGQGLLNFFVRGVSSGALTLDEARESGLTPEELHGRSFLRIVEGRTRRASQVGNGSQARR
jgi:citrate lyase beta subunit